MGYRSAAAEDCGLLARLNAQLIRDENHRNSMSESELEARMRDWLANDYAATLFEEGGTVVAYALYREEAQSVYLRQFFVVREARRKGIGRRAFSLLRSEIWPRSKRVTVDVLLQNHSAIGFWRAEGFVDYYLGMEMPPLN